MGTGRRGRENHACTIAFGSVREGSIRGLVLARCVFFVFFFVCVLYMVGVKMLRG